MKIDISSTTALRFDDGRPVRAASAIAPLGDGWLIAQDDTTFAAWWRGSSVTPLRLFAPVEGSDTFSEDAGTKQLKPDLEAACEVTTSHGTAVLLLGSGSLPTRMRAALVASDGGVTTASLGSLYARIAGVLELEPEDVNLEGACVVGSALRWFQRGHGATDVPSSSVDVALDALLAAVSGDASPGDVPIGGVRRYAFDSSADVALAITDSALLPDGRVLVATTAEDAPDAVADGDVVGSALAVIDDDEVVRMASLPPALHGTPHKVEGLAIRTADGRHLDVLAVVDADDPEAPSLALELTVEL